jgi:hypothetical protein
MAQFFTAKVAQLVRDKDGFVSFRTTLQTAEIESWTLKVDGEADVPMHIPTAEKYRGVPMEYIYDVAKPSIETPPTMVLVRVADDAAVIDAKDVVVAIKDATTWADAYKAMPIVAIHTFVDAVQPADIGLEVAKDEVTGAVTVKDAVKFIDLGLVEEIIP